MTDPLSLVGLIITAYNEAEKAGATALTSALECGKHLRAANLSVTAAKTRWSLTGIGSGLPSIYY
jgi:hypothetical protein